MWFFNYAFFPILNLFTGFALVKAIFHLKVISTIFFGSSFLFGLVSQRLIHYYRRIIIKNIKFTNDEKLGIVLKLELLSGKIISDSFDNIEIRVTNNDYETPHFVFNSQDTNKLSYFIKIKNEEFYICRRLLEINDLLAFSVLINKNRIK